jgi:hypothetical protein
MSHIHARAGNPISPHTKGSLLADNLRRQAAGVGAFSALARLAATARQVQAVLSATRGMSSASPTPRTSLDRVVEADRSLAIIRGNLELARQAAHRHTERIRPRG